MNKYLRLFRFGNSTMGIIGVLVGAFIGVGVDFTDHIVEIFIACAVVVSFMAGGNSLNDYIDREIDKTAHPGRPLPMGEISPKTALFLGIIGLILSIILSMLILSGPLVLIAIAFMIAYEKILKNYGLIGNISIGILTGMLFLLGGLVVGNIEATFIVASMALIVTIGREIAKDIEDMDSDEGRKTLPMKIGIKRASLVASAFLIIGPILSIYPFYAGTFGWMYVFVLVADVMFIYAAWNISRNVHAAQRIAKYAMLVALVAFVLGVI